MNVGSTKLPANNEIELISEEIDKGLNDSTTIRKFLEKRIQIEEEYAKSLQKLCKSQPNLKKIGGITSAFAVMVENLNQYSNHILAIAQKVNDDISEPLNTFIKDLKSEHKTYVSDGQDLAKERKAVFDALRNSKSNYDSIFKDPESDASKIGIAEEEYREQISIANKYENLFHSEKLPKIQNDIQRLETIRMQKMKTNLKKFIAEFESAPIKFTQTQKESEDIVNAIDTKRDIMAFVNFNKSINTATPEFVFEACEKEKKKKGWRSTMSVLGINIGGSSNSGANQQSERVIHTGNYSKHSHDDTSHQSPNAVFHVPIGEVMSKQKNRYPDLDVPYVLVLLVQLIKRNDGFKTEGIFRIPGHNESITLLKKQLNEGDYKVQETNVHVLASLLKLWLREMPQPLIPDALYDKAVQCENTDDLIQIVFKQLPSINQKIVTFIVSFLNDLISPDNVLLSKMNLDNVSMVFAPSFLRCTNPEKILTNVELEKYFIKILIESHSTLLDICPLNLIEIEVNNADNGADENSTASSPSNSFNSNNTFTPTTSPTNTTIPPAIVHLTPISSPQLPSQRVIQQQQQQQTSPHKPPVPSGPLPKPPSSANSTPGTSPQLPGQRPQVFPPLIPKPRATVEQSPPPNNNYTPPPSNNPIPLSPNTSSLSVSGGSTPVPLSTKSPSSSSLLNLSSSGGSNSPIQTPKHSASTLNLSSGSGSSPNSPNLIKKTVRPVLPPPPSLASHLNGQQIPTSSNPLLTTAYNNQLSSSSSNTYTKEQENKIDPEALEILKSMKSASKTSSLKDVRPLPSQDQPSSSPTVPTKSFLNKGFQLPPPPSLPKSG
ncbi:RhoGAP domain-containing protein [Tieghemostelium lacteum]|uniref:RhoGAP domain-containing protein n=1 Tax=Tieghemostelium lacteum TaxID=361077 RepID=A0A152A656_TIELA|nr:RhoGAP domain-containing protein [Tieghemostelium lacteum]|eukprot:KYR01703.1 RhoGAP domain-containing protein [Tieghemostelium lacteum]